MSQNSLKIWNEQLVMIGQKIPIQKPFKIYRNHKIIP